MSHVGMITQNDRQSQEAQDAAVPNGERPQKNGRGLPRHAIRATALGQNAMGVFNSDVIKST
jgi:hypothetical protein